MAESTEEIETTIKSLVATQLRSNEFIQSLDVRSENEVVVRLIDKDLHRKCQQMMKRLGVSRGAGKGRSLSFRLVDEKWELVGTGGWIS